MIQFLILSNYQLPPPPPPPPPPDEPPENPDPDEDDGGVEEAAKLLYEFDRCDAKTALLKVEPEDPSYQSGFFKLISLKRSAQAFSTPKAEAKGRSFSNSICLSP